MHYGFEACFEGPNVHQTGPRKKSNKKLDSFLTNPGSWNRTINLAATVRDWKALLNDNMTWLCYAETCWHRKDFQDSKPLPHGFKNKRKNTSIYSWQRPWVGLLISTAPILIGARQKLFQMTIRFRFASTRRLNAEPNSTADDRRGTAGKKS